MKYHPHLGIVAGIALASIVVSGFAQDQTRGQDQIRDRDIYGYQLMTPQERSEFRARMSDAKTMKERERIRMEHHEKMVERAKNKGIDLPDRPAAKARSGSGMGSGGNRR